MLSNAWKHIGRHAASATGQPLNAYAKHTRNSLLTKMASQEKLAELYRDLNYPSANVFRKALLARGIPARLSDVQEYTRLKWEKADSSRTANV